MENMRDGKHVFRVDRFKVSAARAEFMERSLGCLPGIAELGVYAKNLATVCRDFIGNSLRQLRVTAVE